MGGGANLEGGGQIWRGGGGVDLLGHRGNVKTHIGIQCNWVVINMPHVSSHKIK